jgi:hypothetical protein
MKSSVLALLIVASAGMACGGDSGTTPSTSTSTGSFDTFSSLLGVQGSSFYSFTVAAAGTVSLSLASMIPANTVGPASTSIVRLGLGVPLGTGCSVTSSVDTTAGLTSQLTVPVTTPDIYCANLSDIGNLTTPVNFTIRIGQNITPSSAAATAATSTFATFLSLGGSSTHTFTVSQGGTISLTLTNVSPSVPIGIGLGIPGASTTTCSLTSSLTATAGSAPQISIPVDAGTYCVEAYDAGAVVSPGVAFSMTIVHP